MRRKKRQYSNHLYQNLGIVALSILVAVLIANSSALETFLLSIGDKRLIGSFFAGMLFSSVFSAAPASFLLGELAQDDAIWIVALVGAVGAFVGDYLIFRFVRDRLSEDILALFHHQQRKFKKLLRLPTVRWLVAAVGFLIIASPLPDELGIALLSMAKTRRRVFFFVSLGANFVGILLIGWAARSIG